MVVKTFLTLNMAIIEIKEPEMRPLLTPLITLASDL
jgi:hypothetical protein